MNKVISVETVKVGIIDFPINYRDSIIEKLSLFSLAFFTDTWEIKNSFKGISMAELDQATLITIDFLLRFVTKMYKLFTLVGLKTKSGTLIKTMSPIKSTVQSLEEENYFTLLDKVGNSEGDELEYITKVGEGSSKNPTRALIGKYILKRQLSLLRTRITVWLFGNNEIIEFSSA